MKLTIVKITSYIITFIFFIIIIHIPFWVVGIMAGFSELPEDGVNKCETTRFISKTPLIWGYLLSCPNGQKE